MHKKTLIIIVISFISIGLFAQPKNFKKIVEYPTTKVKNQGNTGTCWCFGTLSFIETEILRTNKKELDLSEKFVVYYNYINKAIMYIRMRGNITFTQGGYSHDVFKVIKKYGIVPETAYQFTAKDHTKLEKQLKNYLDSIVKFDSLDVFWLDGYINILNTNLGKPPTEFEYNEKIYTPKSFYDNILNFNPDNYIEIACVNHHNFYEKFVFEDMYNWALELYYNVSIEDYINIILNSLQKGYTVVWVGDVSEIEFDAYKGIIEIDKYEINKKGNMTDQDFRQIICDLHFTTPDHLMHVTGLYTDENNNNFFKIKNSWGVNTKQNGYIYMSENYYKYKTTTILVNKEALPKNIYEKLFPRK